MWILAAGWTVAVAGLLTWNLLGQRQGLLESARAYARAAHEKDLTYRRWNAAHGGVYVPITEETQPNRFLVTSERDVSIPSGRTLTLVNPAYMTRQVHEMAAADGGIKAHVTNLKPLRPANAPDTWETRALETFEEGRNEFSSIERMDGRPYIRMMRPLVTEEGCIKCHGQHGYKIGDVRGGISVAVPIGGLLRAGRRNMFATSSGYALVWLIGSAGLVVCGISLRRRTAERKRAEEEREILLHDLKELQQKEKVAGAPVAPSSPAIHAPRRGTGKSLRGVASPPLVWAGHLSGAGGATSSS